MTIELTEAGRRSLREFIDAEANGRLVALTNNLDGSDAGRGLPLRHGDGGHLAAAQRLSHQGLVRLVGIKHRRFIIITDAGREAICDGASHGNR